MENELFIKLIVELDQVSSAVSPFYLKTSRLTLLLSVQNNCNERKTWPQIPFYSQ